MASRLTRLLTINVGSSSLKAVLYRLAPAETVEVRAAAERIGIPQQSPADYRCSGRRAARSFGRPPRPRCRAGGAVHLAPGPAPGRGAARHRAASRAGRQPLQRADADHRHGARRAAVAGVPRHGAPAAGPPRHRERSSAPIRRVPQVACFDTAFHRQMPRVAQMYALPRDLWDAGVARYGFHGLSYEYILQELRALDGDAADGRVIVAHLGHGASMAAVHHGVGVDTTMGLTPTGGLVMSTRTGDLDPGVLLYLLESRGLDAAALSRLVNKEAGLLGVSGSSADMQDLLDARGGGSARRRGGRAVLLPGPEVPRRPRGRAGRAGHAGLHGGHRAALRGDPRAHLRRPGVPGPAGGRGAQRRARADHLRATRAVSWSA